MRKGAVVAIIIIAVLVIGGIAGFLVYNMNNQGTSAGSVVTPGQSSSGLDLAIEGNDEQQVQQGKSITMPGWTQIDLPANTTDVTVDFYNPEENKDYCYISFELKLADGTSLCKTGLVSPGDHKRNITLSQALAPGTYNAILYMQPYTMDENRSALNSAAVELELVVS